MATKAKGKPEPAKRDTNTLTVQPKPGDTKSAAIAQTLLRPSVQAAGTLKEYTKQMVDADLVGLIDELAAQATAVNDGDLKRAEAMLTIQAQSQCRATLETSAAVKNPQPVAFVRQANIAAGPQQINNSMAPAGEVSRARETEILQNKLLEVQPGKRLDIGTAAAVGIDPQLEAVGTVHRPQDAGG